MFEPFKPLRFLHYPQEDLSVNVVYPLEEPEKFFSIGSVNVPKRVSYRLKFRSVVKFLLFRQYTCPEMLPQSWALRDDASESLTTFFQNGPSIEYPPLPRSFTTPPPYLLIFLAFALGIVVEFIFLAFSA